MLKRTPLYDAHVKLGGRMVEFGGWEMPVQYSSIVDEHNAVRRAAGVFDISHMGEVSVSGQGASDFLNFVLTNDVKKLAAGQGQYSIMCNDRGGTIDDLYVYRLGEQQYLLIINASRIEPDVDWLRQKAAGRNLRLENVSDAMGAIAVQGPRAVEFVPACFPDTDKLTKNQVTTLNHEGKTIHVARTGYTGEDGFEIVAPADTIEKIWTRILAAGHAHCAQPAGLGARDTLRTEVCYPLYGHELDENTSPIEAGLGFFVALDKGDFIGRNLLAEQKANGVKKKCIAFKMTDKSAPPRPHYAIWSTGPKASKIGEVVSGTQSPSLGIGVGLGYVPPEFATRGMNIDIEIRGKRSPAQIVKKPIYQKQKV
ncbi:MAG TPA: glycine cleavage system aminomethyltransferase GcvT [Candidatus Binatia bacterium]|nr:glycine cleavage system aminomethyltransferase GcvT [Candidatus Binatia bacterium]